MKIESFISRRYLVSKHKLNFITIISIISIIGITIGVAALIVVLSVFNGFGSLVSDLLMKLDPHVKVEFLTDQYPDQQKKIENILSSHKEIKAYSPFVSGKVLAFNSGKIEAVNLKGIKADIKNEIYKLSSKIAFGNYLNEKNPDGIILGISLAERLQVITGDTVTIISPVGIEQSIVSFSLPTTKKFVVAGIYSSDNNEYDRSYIFANLSPAQKILGYNKTYQGYEIQLYDFNESFEIKDKLKMQLDKNDFEISTWFDLHKDLYTMMQVERWTAYIILSLIIAVACFNILGSLTMSVMEKKRDIGILRAMGLNEKSILKIFMFEGVLIGIIGTFAGAVLGYLVCFLQLQFKIYPLDPNQYKVDAMPLEVRLTDFFFIIAISMLLSVISSRYPAKRAAKLNIIESIKWE
jgi:lipoprotein-releasing system permease protein